MTIFLNPLLKTTTRILLCLATFAAGWYSTVEHLRSLRQEHTETIKQETKSEEAEATYAGEALQWYNNQRAFPTGVIPSDWREKALQHIRVNALQKSSDVTFLGWTSVGPNNLGGRVRSIVINPLNPSTIFCGSVSGGIWKSTNSGNVWFSISDDAPSLVIGSMVMSPTDTNTIYAGTGEGYQNIDAMRGTGVLKTTNGGASWTLLNNFQNPPTNGITITKLVINPLNPSTLYASLGGAGGVWKTTNSGTSWTKLTFSTSSASCLDLIMDPSDSTTLYASFGLTRTDGVYKTTNSGSSWTKLTNGFPAASEKYHRISLAISPSNPSILYASVADSNDDTHSIQKSTNKGATWFTASTRAPYDSLLHATHLNKQGWYNNVIAVHPTNPNLVYAGGNNSFRSTNGGTTWSMMTYGYASSKPFMHVDQHVIVFDPTNPSIMYFGNDGGMYKTSDGGNTFRAINNNLAITQFYSGAIHPTDEIYYGGSQDIGIMKSATLPAWTVPFTGDGGFTLVDFTAPTNIYSEYVFLTILKSNAAGAPGTWVKTMSGIPSLSGASQGTSERCDFISPIAMDPSNAQVLYAGTFKIYRTSNGGGSWTAISGDLTGDGPGLVKDDGGIISAITVAKSSSFTVYVGTGYSSSAFSTGTAPSNLPTFHSYVWVGSSTNSGTTWTWSDVTTATLPNRYVRSIAVDPTNANRAFVCYSGYSTGHVYRTVNKGSSWVDVSSNLPDVPVNAVVIDPANTNHIIIGTDIGIFESLDAGGSWIQQNLGLANVCVIDLDLRADEYLFASTHGRGMYKTIAPINSPLSPHLTVSIHQNPLLTRYVDVYLFSDTALSTTAPVASVRIGTTVNDPLSMTAVTPPSPPQIYKGSYEFTKTGTPVLTFLVNDASGTPLSTQRTFQVQFLKQGIPQTIRSTDAVAEVQLSAAAVSEDMIATSIAEPGKTDGIQQIGQAYTFGPDREFSDNITIRFRYESAGISAGTEQHLIIMHKEGTSWKSLKSYIDRTKREVIARLSTLGTFALAYGDKQTSPFLPQTYALAQNFPNPFNPTTTIQYSLPEDGHVTIVLFNSAGQLVSTLLDEPQNIGEHTLVWNGKNDSGIDVATGVYFYRLFVKGDNSIRYSETKKMLLLR